MLHKTQLELDGLLRKLWEILNCLFAGNGVTYMILADNMTLAESSAKEGMVPHNLTLDSASQELLGPGIHQLEIRASSNTTALEISESIAVHLIEPVSGLQAALASHALQLGENLEINVSVSHGAPDKLKFEVIGSNETHSIKEDCPHGEPQTYTIPMRSEGTARWHLYFQDTHNWVEEFT